MIKEKPSSTAVGTALRRATEAKKTKDKRICSDELAKFFVPPNATVMGCSSWPAWMARFYLDYWKEIGVGNYVLVRTRYFDDVLENCIEQGLEQFVVLGAGFDSRAYRFFNENNNIPVFEVDFPTTQQQKKQILQEVTGYPFSYVRFVPINFMTERMDDSLYKAGYQNHLKTLFLWEGVSFYLTKDAVRSTLSFIVNHSKPSSRVVFDYLHFMPEEKHYTRKTWHDTEEPLFWGMPPDKISTFLEDLGYCDIQNDRAVAVGMKYYLEKKRRPPMISPTFSFIQATVAEKRE